MTHVSFQAAGVTVENPEQVVLAKIIGCARLFWRRFCAPEAEHTLLRRRGCRRRGGGGPLAGRAAEVRGQRTGGVLRHHGGQLLWFGVERVAGQHLVQVGEAGGAQHVLMQDRGVVSALHKKRGGSAVQAERHGRWSVRHQTAEGLEWVEEVVSPREEVHVVGRPG